jgi:biotin carboxylase
MKRKILILGGESFSIDIVRQAKALDYHVTVASRHDDGDAKRLADEKLTIDLLDYDAIVKFIKGNNIEGVMAGPSEFHTINMINICKMAGLRCYATPEQWARCSNKETFKKYCRKNGVPTAPEYPIEKFLQKEADKDIEYPLIVKPVDACSSKGITICNNREDVLRAYEFALEASESRHAVIEKYLDNGGSIFGFRYILDKGKSYPYLMFDTYIVDPVNKKYLISAFTYFPSHLTDFFWKEIDKPVRKMFLDMGLENGVAFIQAILRKQ